MVNAIGTGVVAQRHIPNILSDQRRLDAYFKTPDRDDSKIQMCMISALDRMYFCLVKRQGWCNLRRSSAVWIKLDIGLC
jgi:hypothetical protein